MPESVQPYLEFFGRHLYLMVFVVAAIDAVGIPFPGRLLLVVAGGLAADAEIPVVVPVTAAGALAGDHVIYGLGRLGGERAQSLYCRLTGSGRACIPRARAYLDRFGAATILLGRFAFTVRLAVALLAGSGAMAYPRFLAVDAVGALLWAALFILLGWAFGPRAVALLETHGGLAAVLAGAAIGILAIPAFRAWQRFRAAAPVAR